MIERNRPASSGVAEEAPTRFDDGARQSGGTAARHAVAESLAASGVRK